MRVFKGGLFLSIFLSFCIYQACLAQQLKLIEPYVLKNSFVAPPASPCCGNGVCDPSENCRTCSRDCGRCPFCANQCGNGMCEVGETPCSCPNDCKGCCLNGACQPSEGETFWNCEDCATALQGTVVDVVSRAPISNATVRCFYDDLKELPVVRTNGTGFWEHPRIPPENYRCQAWAPTYLPAGAEYRTNYFSPTAGVIGLALLGGSIVGNVVDSNGAPLDDVTVSCTDGVHTTRPRIVDVNGGFFFEELLPGTYRCRGVSQTSNRIVDNSVIVRALEPSLLHLNFPAIVGSVSGRLVNKRGALVGATVTCGGVSTMTAADGSYSLAQVPVGTNVTCKVTAPRHMSWSYELTVREGLLSSAPLGTLEFIGGSIKGLITNERTGAVVPLANISCLSAENRELNVGRSNSRGEFTVRGLLAGFQDCSVSAKGYLPRTLSFTAPATGLTPGANFVLNPVPGRIDGTVYRFGKLRGIRGVQVNATFADGSVLSTTTEPSGSFFIFPVLVPGPVHFTTKASGFLNSLTRANIIDHDGTLQVTIELTAA